MPKILIVDDIEDNRYLLKRRLKRFGFEDCVEAENGFVALDIISDQAVDLVFLDLMMPGMDGFEVLEELQRRQLIDHLPVIMISAADDLEKVARGIELGAEDYLSKPFNPVLLKARTDAALSKRETALEKIRLAKSIDAQTGLSNLQGLEADSSRWEAFGSVVALQLQFHKYNDIYNSYGTATANAYFNHRLEALRSLLEGHTEYHQYALYRVESDSITIVMLDTSSDCLIVLAEQLVRYFSGQLNVDDNVSILESVRVAMSLPDGLVGSSELTRQLVSALSSATQKQPIAIYQESAQSEVLERIRLESELRIAIDQKALAVYYQPQVCTKTQKIVSAEALIRWPHPERGLVSPGIFIPIAEKAGLINDIGLLVVEKVLATLDTLEGNGTAIPISVNIATEHFLADGFLGQMNTLMSKHNDSLAKFVKLELTESTFLDDKESVNTVMQSLRTMGMKISLDDFGTGYSALSYLFQLPIDQLKIDKSFVDALEQDGRAQSIMSHIIALAHDLGFEVVVEGVETQEQSEWVSAANADLIQGFLYYKPLPYKEFIAALQQ